MSDNSPARLRLGFALGLLSAVCYGIVPLFTKPLQDATAGHAMTSSTILFYRFGIAALAIALWMLLRRISFRVTFPEFVTLTLLAFLSDGAALFLIAGYRYMESGVAQTLQFLYPIFTSIIMMCFFGERCRYTTIAAIVMAVAGVACLSLPNGNQTIELTGIVLELFSALCFSFYLIRVGRSRVSKMDPTRLTFYVIALGALIFGAYMVAEQADYQSVAQFSVVPTSDQWVCLIALALACTVLTNFALVISAQIVGPTITSVLGALTPVTAFLLGSVFMGEVLTIRVGVGIALILPAVLLIVWQNRR